MKLATSLIFYLSGLCLTYTTPKDLPHGAYAAPLDAKGEATGPPIRQQQSNGLWPKRSSKAEPAAKDILPISRQGCVNGSYLQTQDEQIAFTSLATWCNAGGTTPASTGSAAYWFDSGNALWYVCSYGRSQACSWTELDEARTKIETSCGGQYESVGWVYMDSWNKGYGKAAMGDTVCGVQTS